MSLPPLLESVRKHPGMYLSRVEFDLAVAFLDGFDLASNGGLLAGFKEWLVVKLDFAHDLTWPGLVLLLTFPQMDSPGSQLLQGDNQKRAVESLFGLLEAFWQEREASEGLRRIYRQYEEWLKRQDWYGPSCPQWIGAEQRRPGRRGG